MRLTDDELRAWAELGSRATAASARLAAECGRPGPGGEALAAAIRANWEAEQALYAGVPGGHRVTADLAAELLALRAENDRLRQGLEDVVDPVDKIRREMRPGYVLDGIMACRLRDDPGHLRKLASDALAGPREGNNETTD